MAHNLCREHFLSLGCRRIGTIISEFSFPLGVEVHCFGGSVSTKIVYFCIKIIINWSSIIANFNGQTEGEYGEKPLPET